MSWASYPARDWQRVDIRRQGEPRLHLITCKPVFLLLELSHAPARDRHSASCSVTAIRTATRRCGFSARPPEPQTRRVFVGNSAGAFHRIQRFLRFAQREVEILDRRTLCTSRLERSFKTEVQHALDERSRSFRSACLRSPSCGKRCLQPLTRAHWSRSSADPRAATSLPPSCHSTVSRSVSAGELLHNTRGKQCIDLGRRCAYALARVDHVAKASMLSPHLSTCGPCKPCAIVLQGFLEIVTRQHRI